MESAFQDRMGFRRASWTIIGGHLSVLVWALPMIQQAVERPSFAVDSVPCMSAYKATVCIRPARIFHSVRASTLTAFLCPIPTPVWLPVTLWWRRLPSPVLLDSIAQTTSHPLATSTAQVFSRSWGLQLLSPLPMWV